MAAELSLASVARSQFVSCRSNPQARAHLQLCRCRLFAYCNLRRVEEAQLETLWSIGAVALISAPIFASFIGVAVDRIPRRARLMWGRSRCNACKRMLAARDLIPIASYSTLAFLSPTLVKAAIDGRLPRGIGVARLRDAPAEWSRQHTTLGLAS